MYEFRMRLRIHRRCGSYTANPFRPSTIVIGADGSEIARIDGPITLAKLRVELDRVLAAA